MWVGGSREPLCQCQERDNEIETPCYSCFLLLGALCIKLKTRQYYDLYRFSEQWPKKLKEEKKKQTSFTTISLTLEERKKKTKTKNTEAQKKRARMMSSHRECTQHLAV